MDRKNSSILVLLLAITIVGGLLASFGIPFLSEGTSRISLSDISQSESSSLGEGGTNAGFIPVRVTTDTVQNVILSLKRQRSYYRELDVETFWQVEDTVQSALSAVKVWTDGDSTMTVDVSDAGDVRRSIIKDGTRYLWYGNDQRWRESPAEQSEGDLAQRILTYEDVVYLPKEYITNAGYEEKNGKYCIFVEYKEDTVGYVERYWIEVDSGLLVAAETKNQEDDRLVHRMTEKEYESPIPSLVQFTLPDGTSLHQTQAPSEAQEED